MKHALFLIPLAAAALATGCRKKVTRKPALLVNVYSIHSANSLDSDYVATSSSFRVTCDSLDFQECRYVSGNGTFYFEQLRPGGYTVQDYYNQKKVIIIGPESDERVDLFAP